MTTEPIDLSADLTQEVEEEEVEEVEAPKGPRTAGAPRGTVRRGAEAPAGNPGMTFALVLSAIFIALGLALALRSGSNEKGSGPLAGTFKKMSGWFYETMGTDQDVQKSIRNATQGLHQAHSTAVTATGGGAGAEGQ
jgi:hypothetical protein